MEKKETRLMQIKEWLEKGRYITPIMAIQMFDCYSLNSVIFVLRYKMGMDIRKEMFYGEGRKKFAKYFLNGVNNEE